MHGHGVPRPSPDRPRTALRRRFSPGWLSLGAIVAAAIGIGAFSAATEAEDLVLAMPTPTAISVPAAPTASAVEVRAARTSIERANAQWRAAFRSGDSASLARIYAPDASLFPPSAASIEGRDRIIEYFGAQRRAGIGEADLKTLDVVVVGDVAYEVGTYRFRFDGERAGLAGDAGRYFAIWKASGGSNWRYQVGIWSSNRDVAPRP